MNTTDSIKNVPYIEFEGDNLIFRKFSGYNSYETNKFKKGFKYEKGWVFYKFERIAYDSTKVNSYLKIDTTSWIFLEVKSKNKIIMHGFEPFHAIKKERIDNFNDFEIYLKTKEADVFKRIKK